MMPPLPWKLTGAEIRLSGRTLTVLHRGQGVAVELAPGEATEVWSELGCRQNVVGLELRGDAASAELAWNGLRVRIGSVEVLRSVRRRTWEQFEAAERAARTEGSLVA